MRRALVALLAAGMAVLSYDALRAYALTGRPLTDGVIPQTTFMPRPYLAMLWALVIDLSVAASILGVKDDRRDWRAWLMLLLALAATLGFQVFALSPFVARAVPPVGLALAILVLDLGPARPKPEREASGPPAPARFHRWLRSWDDVDAVGSVRAGIAGPGEDPGPAVPVPGSRSRRQQAATPAPHRSVGRSVTPDQWATIDRMLAEGRPALSISKELGLSDRGYKNILRRRAELADQNGDRP